MPRIAGWSQLPHAIRDHLVERMRDRKISLDDLNQLRLWIESTPEVPRASGIRTSGHSNCAVRQAIPRPSYSPVKRLKAGSFRNLIWLTPQA
jgi:hypothetical protein